jgi:3-oxoacyl-[acyl-carrier protein] reductase
VRAGKVLAGMTKRIWPEAQSFTLADRASLEQALQMLEQQDRAGHGRLARHRPRHRRAARQGRGEGHRHSTSEEGAKKVPGIGMVLDVRDAAQTESLITAIQKQHGDIAILVNNAGITRDNLALRMKDAEFDEVIDTNLRAVFRLSRAVMRGMMKARWGRIINVTSVVGASGNAGQANYAAAKAAVAGMTRSLARELGSPQHHGELRRAGLHRHRHDARAVGRTEKGAARADSARPPRRAQDVAAAVAYLASPAAGYVTARSCTSTAVCICRKIRPLLGRSSGWKTSNNASRRSSPSSSA